MRYTMKRARRYAGALAGFAALTIAGKACSDLTAPAGVNEVAVNFRLPAGSTRLDLIVGDSIRPDVVVMLGAQETSRARSGLTGRSTTTGVESDPTIPATRMQTGPSQMRSTYIGTIPASSPPSRNTKMCRSRP